MKRTTLTVLSLALAASFSGTALSQDYDRNRDQGRHQEDTTRRDVARVMRVERMSAQRDSYQRQECWNERTRQHESGYYRDESGRLYQGDDRNKSTRTVIGAIIGGVLGNQVGDGSGRTAATVAGAVIGGAVGNNSGNDRRNDNGYDGYDRYRDNSGIERRCRTVAGYDDRGHGRDSYRVSYTYGGKSYQAMTSFNPGRTLRVLVDVRPEQDDVAYRR